MATPAMPTEDFNTAYNSEDPCTHVLIVEGGKWRESFVDLYASDMYRFESGDSTPDHHAYMFKSGRVWDTVNGWRWGQTASVEAPQGRTFETGAYRDTDNGKLDYEAFLCPRVLESYAQYMHKNRIQSDGKGSSVWIRINAQIQRGLTHNVIHLTSYERLRTLGVGRAFQTTMFYQVVVKPGNFSIVYQRVIITKRRVSLEK